MAFDEAGHCIFLASPFNLQIIPCSILLKGYGMDKVASEKAFDVLSAQQHDDTTVYDQKASCNIFTLLRSSIFAFRLVQQCPSIHQYSSTLTSSFQADCSIPIITWLRPGNDFVRARPESSRAPSKFQTTSCRSTCSSLFPTSPLGPWLAFTKTAMLLGKSKLGRRKRKPCSLAIGSEPCCSVPIVIDSFTLMSTAILPHRNIGRIQWRRLRWRSR